MVTHVLGRRKKDIPIYLFCHHKTGTNLLSRVFRDICLRERWSFVVEPYQVESPPDGDIVLFQNSTINPRLIKTPFFGIHMIRDPREVIVSGYFYHKKTHEPWCISKDFNQEGPPTGWPVPMFMQHKSKVWADNYISSLGGLSYREHLNQMSQEDGMTFEMKNLSSWTIRNMLDWQYDNPSILEIKMEDVRVDYDKAFSRMFDHLEFEPRRKRISMRCARYHDVGRMSPSQLKRTVHVRTKEVATWNDHFSDDHKMLFKELFGADCCSLLRYED
jgi:hypothetical protein